MSTPIPDLERRATLWHCRRKGCGGDIEEGPEGVYSCRECSEFYYPRVRKKGTVARGRPCMYKALAEISQTDYRRLDELATESGRPMSLLIDDLMHTAIKWAYVEREGATRRVLLPASFVCRHTPESEATE